MKPKMKAIKRIAAIVMVTTLIASTLVIVDARATAKGTAYPTAQEAVDALVAAAEKFDEAALATILGPSSTDIINTGEPGAGQRDVTRVRCTGTN